VFLSTIECSQQKARSELAGLFECLTMLKPE
jgi:hypothetical protein